MSMVKRSKEKDKQVEKGIAYAKASLAMEGLHMSERAEKLIRLYGQGEITKEQLFQELGRE